MLGRYQILLNDWQADHYKLVAKKYDVSFSEMIRMALCLDIIYATRLAFPKYRTKINDQVLKRVINKRQIAGNMTLAQFHSLLSKIYFESRKATEFWQEKKIKEVRQKI
ncbi:hypothetical protein ACFL1I_00755 [Candidatus Omnitrophota bacterium]